jgi:glycosyltransferase involved in cell wall biosynthesis
MDQAPLSFLDQIAVVVLTYNEAPNIGRTLEALSRFPEVVVLDSGSTDDTIDIVNRYPNARSVSRPFDTHAVQWNHGLTSCGIERPWVLALDADYRLPAALVEEISLLQPVEAVSGYLFSFSYCIFGMPLSATLYPPVVALYLRERARYVQEGHTQRLIVSGAIERVSGRIEHDDRKPLDRWIASQQKYAKLEVDHLMTASRASLRGVDRIRLLAWPAPIFVLIYTLFMKRCILDGLPGWLYALQRTLAELMIAMEIVDRSVRAKCEDEMGRRSRRKRVENLLTNWISR